MPKITKRIVDAAEVRETDYVVWDDELPGFGLRVFASGKRSYVIQYRAAGRSRRYTLGLHGVWTPETARQEAKIQFGRVAQGDNPDFPGQGWSSQHHFVAERSGASHEARPRARISCRPGAAGEAVLKRASQLLDAQQIPYQCEVLVGMPPAEIASTVDRYQIDLIVMGSTGMGALARLFLGSVATAVTQESKVPVTLVK